ncbi:YqhG family protein [Paenibacillus zanthoxyli]|uniref:YqhG family protein n=1 Tax=Paenibacillus zanthoxyli TaxID=369399 RepID=UPI000471456B|nr:YqhG family protein [Paenibacillus zanthoxyli]
MTMTAQQVQKHVMDYLEATECQIIEKSPVHVTVKLSPRADQMLTDRPYYWGFVERTGAEPQTLSFTFVFDPEKYDAAASVPAPRSGTGPGSRGLASQTPWGSGAAAGPGDGTPGGNPGPGAGSNPGADAGGAAGAPIGGGKNTAANNGPNDGLLGRYFGVTPVLPRLGPGLIRREDITFGSRRLRQIWSAAQTEGKCLYLFEATGNHQRMTLFSAAYEPWLAVCFKVELSCDLKREELHFIGISLLTGEIKENFNSILDPLELTPRLPENVHIQPYEISLSSGAGLLERHILSKLSGQDYSWAEAARRRLQGELEIIDAYYSELLKEQGEEKRIAAEEQHASRRKETIWQYEPNISVSPVVYGLFHLRKQ